MTKTIMIREERYAMAKMGRPKKENKKEKVISVRLSDETYQKLLAYISNTDQTMTEVILRGLEKELSSLE